MVFPDDHDDRLSSYRARDDGEQSFTLELTEMDERRLQGFIGEKVISLFKNRLHSQLETYVPDGWDVNADVNVVSTAEDPHPSTRFLPGGHGSINVDGRNVLHSGKDQEEVNEHIQEISFAASPSLFEKFQSFSHPFVDTVFYATQTNGDANVEFLVQNVTSRVDHEASRSLAIPRLQDFKVLLVEIKTTNSDASKLLSSNQRSLRDLAAENRYVEFYTLQVTSDFKDLNLPSEFHASLQEH
mgnify:CR=1 FL=1